MYEQALVVASYGAATATVIMIAVAVRRRSPHLQLHPESSPVTTGPGPWALWSAITRTAKRARTAIRRARRPHGGRHRRRYPAPQRGRYRVRHTSPKPLEDLQMHVLEGAVPTARVGRSSEPAASQLDQEGLVGAMTPTSPS